MQQLADANVSETQTLSYTLENMDDAKNKAVEDAYRRARNSADTLARAAERSVGELSYASIDIFENPRVIVPHIARAMSAMANAGPAAPTEEFTPQSVTVTAHVNALFGLKQLGLNKTLLLIVRHACQPCKFARQVITHSMDRGRSVAQGSNHADDLSPM